jgi:hypothetical protein
MRGTKTGGRKMGTPNKLTASAREAIEQAFEGMGGTAAFTEWAKIHRTVFYTRIWPKLLPLQIAGGTETALTVRWQGEMESAREELDRKLEAIQERMSGGSGGESPVRTAETPADAYPLKCISVIRVPV